MNKTIKIPERRKGFQDIKIDYLQNYENDKNYFLIKKIYLQFENDIKQRHTQLNLRFQHIFHTNKKLDIHAYYYKLNFLMDLIYDYLDLKYNYKVKKKAYPEVIKHLQKFNLIALLFLPDENILQLFNNFKSNVLFKKQCFDLDKYINKLHLQHWLPKYYRNFYYKLKANHLKYFKDNLKKWNYTFLFSEPDFDKKSSNNFNNYFYKNLEQLNYNRLYVNYSNFIIEIARLQAEFDSKLKEPEIPISWKLKGLDFPERLYNYFHRTTEINVFILLEFDIFLNQTGNNLAIFFEACNTRFENNQKLNKNYTRKKSVIDTFENLKKHFTFYKLEFKEYYNFNSKDLILRERKYRTEKKQITGNRKKITTL